MCVGQAGEALGQPLGKGPVLSWVLASINGLLCEQGLSGKQRSKKANRLSLPHSAWPGEALRCPGDPRRWRWQH